ncbi:MAG TPA: sulfate ABC transporter permease subunit CysT [Chthoniobacteraceae bacterium]|nr:sulfate ABC transporter permease subunit CysT [Chthoniobacteraceae bacterium]
MPFLQTKKHALPGFRLTLGYTAFYLSAIVLIPFGCLFAKAFYGPFSHAWRVVSNPEVVASYKLSFGASLTAALVNAIFGFLTAWTLTRYQFPGRRILDAFVDFPFALPTAVAGIALTELYAPHGWIGAWLARAGITVAYTPLGIVVALVFIGFPFVVRTVQPVLAALTQDVEEAAACLGASRWQTFRRVILPAVIPSLLTGVTLAFGRAVGEYGSVVFISANLPFKTEITPVLIVSRLEQYDYQGAAAIGIVMLLLSLFILLLVNLIQYWNGRRTGHVLVS